MCSVSKLAERAWKCKQGRFSVFVRCILMSFSVFSGILHLLFLITNTLVTESDASWLLITKPIIRHDFEPVPSINTLTGYHPKLQLKPSRLNLSVRIGHFPRGFSTKSIYAFLGFLGSTPTSAGSPA